MEGIFDDSIRSVALNHLKNVSKSIAETNKDVLTAPKGKTVALGDIGRIIRILESLIKTRSLIVDWSDYICSEDLKDEIIKLTDQNIDGIFTLIDVATKRAVLYKMGDSNYIEGFQRYLNKLEPMKRNYK